MKYYSAEEIINITHKKRAAILQYARTHSDEFETIGKGTGKRYLWTESDLKKYQEYIKNNKPGHPFKETFEKSAKYDTIYHRMIRAKARGKLDIYEQCKKELEALKKAKSDNQEVKK